MAQFGEHGFERATIRAIAEQAGVSPGLVRHHFGSKQGLRDACDDHLVKLVRRLNADVRGADLAKLETNPVAASRAAMKPYQRYVGRALAEGAAAKLFDEMVKLSEEWQTDADRARSERSDVPPRVRAAIGTAMALSVAVLHEHLTRVLGVELDSPEGDLLLARALLDIYSHPIMSVEDAAAARAAIDRVSTPHRVQEARDE